MKRFQCLFIVVFISKVWNIYRAPQIPICVGICMQVEVGEADVGCAAEELVEYVVVALRLFSRCYARLLQQIWNNIRAEDAVIATNM
jgi:hypothetical protein